MVLHNEVFAPSTFIFLYVLSCGHVTSFPDQKIPATDDKQLGSLRDRIIGGQEVSTSAFPYQLSLEGGRRHICGGSVLSEVWALTAAHCVYNKPLKWLQFRAGSSQREKGGTEHPVKYYVYHDKFRQDSLDYDVAVVSVQTPFIMTASVVPVLLPYSRVLGEDTVVVSGWGYLENQLVNKPKLLRAAVLKTLKWEDCSKLYSGQVTDRMMCAGGPGKDICNGDSGGPLVKGSRQQVGIVSWAYQCADGMPSVYTNLSTVEDWVRNNTNIKTSETFFFID